MQGKVISRNITKTGKLHFSIEVITKAATDKNPAETKIVNSILEMPQVDMAMKLGATIPVVGTAVVCEYNVNPTTGAISDEWVSFTM